MEESPDTHRLFSPFSKGRAVNAQLQYAKIIDNNHYAGQFSTPRCQLSLYIAKHKEGLATLNAPTPLYPEHDAVSSQCAARQVVRTLETIGCNPTACNGCISPNLSGDEKSLADSSIPARLASTPSPVSYFSRPKGQAIIPPSITTTLSYPLASRIRWASYPRMETLQ